MSRTNSKAVLDQSKMVVHVLNNLILGRGQMGVLHQDNEYIYRAARAIALKTMLTKYIKNDVLLLSEQQGMTHALVEYHYAQRLAKKLVGTIGEIAEVREKPVPESPITDERKKRSAKAKKKQEATEKKIRAENEPKECVFGCGERAGPKEDVCWACRESLGKAGFS